MQGPQISVLELRGGSLKQDKASLNRESQEDSLGTGTRSGGGAHGGVQSSERWERVVRVGMGSEGCLVVTEGKGGGKSKCQELGPQWQEKMRWR